MAITDLITKVIAEDQFSQTFNKYNSQVDDAEGRTDALGRGLGKLAAVAGSLAIFSQAAQAVSEYVDAAAEASQAEFNLADAVSAANEQFDVGTLQSWKSAIEEVGQATKIYSDQDLENASAKIVDMTKRLGLSEEQMKSLLPITANLSAGKFEIANGAERVTAALRGEAESAEALGLTLSETQVIAYAEAHGLVASQLTDEEKVQIRLTLLYDQANAKMDRAAGFAETLAGKQAALNAQLENQNAAIGEQLIPLWEGYATVVGLVASEGEANIGLISQSLATLLATLLTLGVGFTTWKDQALAAVGNVKAGFDALIAGENPFTAIAEAEEASREQMSGFSEFLADIPGVFNSTRDQIISGWQEQGQAAEEAAQSTVAATQTSAEAFDVEAAAARQAADAVAAEHEKALEQREKATAQFTNKVADLEFDHGQRMVNLQREVAQQIAEAHQEALEARQEAAQELASGLAEIEADLAQETTDAQRALAQELADIDQDRAQAAAERNRTLADIERELAEETKEARRQLNEDLREIDQDRTNAATERGRELRNIERELAQELSDLDFEAGQDRAKIAADLEADKLSTQQDFAKRRADLERSSQDELKRINDEFSDAFADADPFQRQILEFNKAEQIKHLEEGQAAEQQALADQEAAAVAALEQKASAEQAILDAQSARERERLEADAAFARLKAQEKFQDTIDELAQKQAALEADFAADQARRQREADARRADAEQRFADETAQLERRRAQAQAEAAEAQARREADAVAAREALQAKHTEELANIDEQEAKRVAKANEQIAREQQNYADRMAALQRDNQQTQAEIDSHLAEIERQEADSWGRRVNTAQQASEEIRRANEMAAQGGFGSGGGGSSGGNVTNAPTIIVQGSPVGGFAGANQNASIINQGLMDTLNGGA